MKGQRLIVITHSTDGNISTVNIIASSMSKMNRALGIRLTSASPPDPEPFSPTTSPLTIRKCAQRGQPQLAQG